MNAFHQLQIDPDSYQPCSWGAPTTSFIGGPQTCGPCPPLNLALSGGTSNGTTAVLTGTAPASLYQSCLRRLYVASTAYGGEEVPGNRTIAFSAHRAGSPLTQAAMSTAQLTWVLEEARGLTCSELLPQGPRITFTAEKPPTQVYQAGCLRGEGGAAGPCAATGYYRTLQPQIAVTYPPGATVPTFIQFASMTLDWKRLQGVQARDQDRFWVAPVSSGTLANPCPNITAYEMFSDAPPPSGGFQGIILAGPASTAAFTTCLRAAYYYNLAAEGHGDMNNTIVAGERLFETTTVAPKISGL